MAAKNRDIDEGLIFDSDRGVQYASKKIVNVLDSYKKITRSMSRKGNCWDNAVAESFFKSLKTELPATLQQLELNCSDLFHLRRMKAYHKQLSKESNLLICGKLILTAGLESHMPQRTEKKQRF